MTFPVYKIETWTGGVKDHTITDEALDIMVKHVLTANVGTFSFTVPTKKVGGYMYDDIALNDTVKIWLDYDSVGATPDFVGKVCLISAPLSTDTGFVRIIKGRDQGEILRRRLKTQKIWNGIGASTIVTELATDLGLGAGEIAADATAVTLKVDAEPYFDVTQKVSDYWANAGSQVKKDFYVDVSNNLVWKARPIRAAGVETLTVGDNILSYNVLRLIDAIKNDITVYGESGKIGVPGRMGRTEPSDKDAWTIDDPANWPADYGTVTSQAAAPKVGANYLRCQSELDAGMHYTLFRRDISGSVPGFGRGRYQTANFYYKHDVAVAESKLRIYAPDNANYFETDLDDTKVNWTFYQVELGENQEYDVDENPTAPWTKTGSPLWDRITWIVYYARRVAGFFFFLDGLFFGHGRFRSTASDAASKASYGTRDIQYLFDSLSSDSECQSRAETMLYQLKDPPVRIDVETVGNTNILIGDRLSMTIPAENISAANFDVTEVTHRFNNQGFRTLATMVNSANIRQMPPSTLNEVLLHKFDAFQRELGKGAQLIK